MISDETTASIGSRIAAVRRRIADACERSGRDPAHVREVGISKTHGADVVAAAILKLCMLKGGKDRWLLRVLQSRPELRRLAKPVLAELAKWPA